MSTTVKVQMESSCRPANDSFFEMTRGRHWFIAKDGDIHRREKNRREGSRPSRKEAADAVNCYYLVKCYDFRTMVRTIVVK